MGRRTQGRRTRLEGQTLVELLIASAVISTGLFAAATLVFSNLALSDRDSDEIVAVNLAREGIEQAKQLRDSNWLAALPFDTFLKNGTDYTATPRWDGGITVSTISFDFDPDAMTDALTVVRTSAFGGSPEFLTQVDVSAPATPFRRLLTFHPICELVGGGLSYLNDGQSCAVGEQKIGIRVESRISWTRKANTFERAIYEDIFDWR
ncbi:type II secretion system GspH family protein [Patescibacteria group bacterium]|nr:type II secretion system GspH family protein [Patescibacteria group bacterium]